MAKLVPPVGKKDHIKGDLSAPVVLTKFGDYECPFCGKAYYVIERLLSTKGDEFAFVFRQFPLTDIHPHALTAAMAAEAAGLQKKFWKMHSLLFENQSLLDDEYILAYAEEAGLDINRFLQDISSDRVTQKVAADMRSGVESGVDSTPTFFINGNLYEGPYDYGVLSNIIDAVASRAPYKKVRDNYELSRSKQ
jgi:protein-disulfide isomerase